MIAGSRAGIARLKAIAAITFLLAAGLAVWLFAGGGANRLWGSKAAPPAGTLEAAVVNAEWDQALRLLNTGNPKGSRSVALFVRGLALLASNRNNESLACFAQAQAPGNLRKWDHYTARLARSYPEIASAHYVRGDALARLGRWDRAIEEFGVAVELDPQLAVAHNALGICHAVRKNWSAAINDSEAAIRCCPSLADAYATRGFINIHKKAGAKGAVEWFNKALRISPRFALALHGRGCAELALNHVKEAERDLTAAQKLCPRGARPMLENLLSIEAYMRGMSKKELVARLAGREAGTTLGRQLNQGSALVNDWVNNPTQRNYNRVSNWANKLSAPEQAKFFDDEMSPALRDHRDLALKAHAYQQEIGRWNNGFGGRVGDLIKAGTRLAGGLSNLGGPWTKTGGATAAAGGELLGSGLKDLSSRNLKTHDIFMDGYQHFSTQNKIDLTPPGGVDMSLAAATMDDGEWPFEPCYGLSYSIEGRNGKG